MENVRKLRSIKLVITERRRNYLISEPNYQTTTFFTEKPVYLDLSILNVGKTVMYEFWYNNVKPKFGENAKLYYIDTDGFIVHVKALFM